MTVNPVAVAAFGLLVGMYCLTQSCNVFSWWCFVPLGDSLICCPEIICSMTLNTEAMLKLGLLNYRNRAVYASLDKAFHRGQVVQ